MKMIILIIRSIEVLSSDLMFGRFQGKCKLKLTKIIFFLLQLSKLNRQSYLIQLLFKPK